MITDVKIRASKPKDKPYKLADGKGLHLTITPEGGRWWRLRYRHGGKEKMLSLGTYPEVGLGTARDRRDAARKLIANGIDPSAERKASKSCAADTFEAMAREFMEKNAARSRIRLGSATWTSLSESISPHWVAGQFRP